MGPADDISDHDPVEAAERHADHGNEQGVLDRRKAFAEDDAIMVEREMMVGPECLDDRGKEQQPIKIQNHTAQHAKAQQEAGRPRETELRAEMAEALPVTVV